MEECIEENQQQSPHSPGTVRNEEKLARFVQRSDHLTEDGALAPAAFPVQDLLNPSRGGLSVARVDHMTREEVRRRTSANQIQDMAVAEAKAVRAIRENSARIFCVLDGGEPDFQAHAVVRLAAHLSLTPSSARRVRRQLMHTFAIQPSD